MPHTSNYPTEDVSPDSWSNVLSAAACKTSRASAATGRLQSAAKTRPRGTNTTHREREDVAAAIAPSFAKREHP